MPRRKNKRSSESDQNTERSMTEEGGNQSLSSVSGSESRRAERMRGAGAHGDASAGDEGIDDAISRGHRDDMSETPMQGDRLQREQSQRSMRTRRRQNDERFDEASEFSGRGGQKEGAERSAEGTGYTERSE